MANFTLHDLEDRVRERAKAERRRVLYAQAARPRRGACAKKLGEEAVETVLAAVSEDREHVIEETADLLYHLLVVLAARGIALAEVEAARLGANARKRMPRVARPASAKSHASSGRPGSTLQTTGNGIQRRWNSAPTTILSPYRTFSRDEWAAGATTRR